MIKSKEKQVGEAAVILEELPEPKEGTRRLNGSTDPREHPLTKSTPDPFESL
jgi:hypothetical protein